MTTIFKALTDAMVSALSGVALAAPNIWPNRLRAIPAGRNHAIVVRLGQSTGEELVLGFKDWVTDFKVECYARGSAGEDPAAAVDPLLQDVFALLSGIDSGTLNAMGLLLDVGIGWDFDAEETPMACAVLVVKVFHRSPANSISAPEPVENP
jgi:hypothetical protein